MAKKRINSNKKGKTGEREVAKLLTEWWGGEFSRTPDSGAFMTTHTTALLESGNDLSGDIITPSDFPFNVEGKRRKIIDLWELVRTPTPSLDEQLLKDNPVTWWYQSSGDASHSNKIPMIIMREDRKQWYCALPYIFRKVHKLSFGHLEYGRLFYICCYKDLKKHTKNEMIEMCNRYKALIQ